MHGDKSQRQREAALARFERGDVLTLVATDVAARGIDVPDVVRVFNYDAPEDRAAYVHRIGRTGRAGRTGTGISFVLSDEVGEMRKIAKSLGLEFEGRTESAGAKPRREERGRDGKRPSGDAKAPHGAKRSAGDAKARRHDDRPVVDGPRRKRRRRRQRKPASTTAAG